jgi:hypothetical protein
VVFYDVKDRRAWLIDGLSALLHLVRASLEHSKTLDYPFEFQAKDLKEAGQEYTGKAAARAVLKNEDNQKLKLYKILGETVVEKSEVDGKQKEIEKTNETWVRFSHRVEDIYHTLENIFEHQLDEGSQDGVGGKVRNSLRRHLEGFDFKDVATETDPIYPKCTTLLPIGKGWVDFTRAIHAITLFGTRFGEILEPTRSAGDSANAPTGGPTVRSTVVHTLCQLWAKLPEKQDLLAVSSHVIRDIMGEKACENQQLWELVDNIYWHNPDKAFDQCDCGRTGKKCDRVQVLLPTHFPRLRTKGFRSPGALPDNGAIIFGHSITLPLIWEDKAGSVPGEGHPQPESPVHTPNDSGLGTSLTSSTRGETSSNIPSVLPAASDTTLDTKVSLLNRAVHKLRRLRKPKPGSNLVGDCEVSGRTNDPGREAALSSRL